MAAPVFSNLATNGSTTDATSFATASVTPASGSIVLICCANQGNLIAATPTGASITGTTLLQNQGYATIASPSRHLAVWVATATGSAGAITFDFSATTVTSIAWSIVEVTNVNTATGTLGVVQSVKAGTNTDATWPTLTLATFGSTNNPTFSICATNASAVELAAKASYTSAHKEIATPGTSILAQWIATNDTAPNGTNSGANDTGAVGLELAALTVAAVTARPIVVTAPRRRPRRTRHILVRNPAAPPAQSPEFTPASIAVTVQTFGRTAAQSLAVTPATVTITAQTSGRTPGAATPAVTPTTVTVTPQTFGATTAKTVGVTPAVITITGVAFGRTPGAAARAVAPATVTLTGQVFAPATIDSLPLTPATLTVTALASARTVGGVTRPVVPATVTVAAQPFARTAAISRPLTPTTVTLGPFPFTLNAATARALAVVTVLLAPRTFGLTVIAPHRACVELSLAGVAVALAVSETTRVELSVTRTCQVGLVLEECTP